jgi:type VI secretion system protein ImpH
MATPSGGPATANPAGTTERDGNAQPSPKKGEIKLWGDRSVETILYEEPFSFDFFQAMRILERLQPEKHAVARGFPPLAEVVRLKAHLSLNFPPSSIYDLVKPTEKLPVPALTVAFLGLFGPSGMMPRHYTELLLRIDKEGKGREKNSLRDWFDLFNHRLISLFYRAWEKYRFYIPYERGEYALAEPDAFTLGVFSLIGMGMKSLRSRLRVSQWVEEENEVPREKPLASIDDLVLLYYSGFLAHRPRNAVSLEALLFSYFQLPVNVRQFEGQWLVLDPANQSRMGNGVCNNQLGVSVVAGERVWDVQSKFRVRLGPLRFASFTSFMPDRAPIEVRKAFFLLSHLVRLYAGPEFDFEVQLVLQANDVPECELSDEGIGPRLGWNTWVRSLEFPHDAEEAVFLGEEIVWVDRTPPLPQDGE